MTEVAELAPGEDERLVAFLAGFPGESRGVEFWRARLELWWARNPAFDGGMPRGWVVRDGEAIVGFIGRVPSRLQIDGAIVAVAGAATWRVLPEFRAQSLALLFALVSSDPERLVLFTTANARARQVMDRLRFAVLEAGDDVVSELPAGAGPAAPAVSGGVAARPLSDADAGFDRLWAATRGQFATSALRSAEVIRWYCFASDYQRKELIGAYAGDELRGFAIAQRLTLAGRDLLQLRDLWADLDDAETIDALCAGTLAEARRLGCEALRVPPLEPRVSACLRRLGARQEPAGPSKLRARVPRGMAAALAPPHAYLTEQLGDTGL